MGQIILSLITMLAGLVSAKNTDVERQLLLTESGLRKIHLADGTTLAAVCTNIRLVLPHASERVSDN